MDLDVGNQFFEPGKGANNGTEINTNASALQSDVIDILGGRATGVNLNMNKFYGRRMALRLNPGNDPSTATAITGTLQVDLRASASVTSAGALSGTPVVLETVTLTQAQFRSIAADVDVGDSNVFHMPISYTGTHGRYLDVQFTPQNDMSTIKPVVQAYLVPWDQVQEVQTFTKVQAPDKTAISP